MANIQDYIDWRGDLTFKQSPFNEVDNVILSQLAYVNFEGIVPGIQYNEDVTLKAAAELYFKMHEEDEKQTQGIKVGIALLKKLAATTRFSDLRLCKYINKIEYTEAKQFSAIHMLINDGTTYIAYRGTDDAIVGWKEDFHMSFMMPVPSQIEAVEYLEKTTKWNRRKLRLGGHSKGGNLAIYAGVMASSRVRNKIIEIYNNDGPGFKQEMLEKASYKEMLSKIKTIVPQSSVVGMLLEHEEEYVVVKSKKSGLTQHEVINWEVAGPQLVYVESVSKGSKKFAHTIRRFLNNLEASQREQFVEIVFDIIDATGAKTVGELTSYKLKNVNTILKTYSTLDQEMKEILGETIKILMNEYYKVFKESIGKTK